MRRYLVVLLTCLSLLAVVACGSDNDGDGDDATTESTDSGDSGEPADGGDGEALTKEELIERGDAICAELSVASDLIELPQDESELASFLSEQVELARTARDDMAALTPPEDGEAVHQALLSSIDAAIELVDGAVVAAEAGDMVTAGDLLTEAAAAGDASAAAAQEYGFQECGSEETEEG